jgi:NADH-quinone oxidoreductase subunit M
MTALDGIMLAGIGTAVLAPLAGAAAIVILGERVGPRVPALLAVGASLIAAVVMSAAWFQGRGAVVTWGLPLTGGALVQVDGLTALLVPYLAVVDCAIVLVAPRRTLVPEAAARLLAGMAATLALFSTAHPVALVSLWGLTILSTWQALRIMPGGRPTARVYALFMAASFMAMTAGTILIVSDPPWLTGGGPAGVVGGWLVAAAVLIRKGLVPVHAWYPALYTGGSWATALVTTIPQIATYTAVRLLVGHADGVTTELLVLSWAALLTAVYGGLRALVQRDVRGLVGTLAMSQSALVFAGLAGTVPTELCGALAIWISSGLALTGMGLVAWALESRAGRISIETLQGRFADAPELAAFLLLFGLASLGLPGTLSFVADDLIVSGSLEDRLGVGLLVIIATVCGGIAVVRGWFHVFGGAVEVDAPRHSILPRERVACISLLVILFALGLMPGPFVRSLESVAAALLSSRHPSSHSALPGDHP